MLVSSKSNFKHFLYNSPHNLTSTSYIFGLNYKNCFINTLDTNDNTSRRLISNIERTPHS